MAEHDRSPDALKHWQSFINKPEAERPASAILHHLVDWRISEWKRQSEAEPSEH